MNLLPFLCFVVVYLLADLTKASVALWFAMVFSMLLKIYFKYKVEPMDILNLLVVSILLIISLVFGASSFILYKKSLVFLSMAVILITASFVTSSPPIKIIFIELFDLSDRQWYQLNNVWIFFSLFMSFVNYFIVIKCAETKALFLTYTVTSLSIFIFLALKCFFLFNYIKK